MHRFSLPFIKKQIAKMSSQNSNPGNFANRPKEEVRNIASKGGQSGHANKGFASMDPDKQVSWIIAKDKLVLKI